MKSKFLTLGIWDFLKGLVLAILTSVITFLADILQAGIVIDTALFKRIGIAAVIALLSYLVKNFFTNSKDQILTPEK
jgi:hypothetical protein